MAFDVLLCARQMLSYLKSVIVEVTTKMKIRLLLKMKILLVMRIIKYMVNILNICLDSLRTFFLNLNAKCARVLYAVKYEANIFNNNNNNCYF